MANNESNRRTSAVVGSLRRTLYDRLQHDLDHDPKVAHELAQGKRVSFYRLKGQLGYGNFSRVKLAIHLLTSEKVAIKIIDKTRLDEHARRLLSREITCMERLDHPNVIRLFEVIETFPKLHLVMECASEGDLHARINKEGPFDEEDGRHIFAQVVAAINHMHKKGVIHRDLKAENVFFTSSTQIKVGDFGFSTDSNVAALDTFCGSPPYAAPELFCEENYSGPLVDIWAMGVLLYFMLSGNMPFRGDTVPKLKEKILEGQYHMPKNLTPTCKDLISGLLTQDASERYTMDDVCGSAWIRRNNDVPCSSRDSGVGGSKSTLTASFNTGDTIDPEALHSLEQLGVPISNTEQLLGEPRNPLAGAYRILLHRKHTSGLSSVIPKNGNSVPHEEKSVLVEEGRAEVTAGVQTARKSKFCIIL